MRLCCRIAALSACIATQLAADSQLLQGMAALIDGPLAAVAGMKTVTTDGRRMSFTEIDHSYMTLVAHRVIGKIEGAATAIAAGSLDAYAIGSDGHLYAWGSNLHGQLGDGTNTGPETCSSFISGPCSTTPVQVSLPSSEKVTGSLAIGADVLVLVSTPDTVPGTL